MTGEELLKNMDLIDPELVEAADTKHIKGKKRLLKWGSMAAGAAAAIVTLLLIIGQRGTGTVVMVGNIERHYKSIAMGHSETTPYYPPEYLTEMERYTSMVLGNTPYRTRARAVSPDLLGEPLGICQCTTYDVYSDRTVTAEKKAYAISGISPSELVAVELGEEFCVFLKEDYSPPADFGTFWDSVALADHVDLVDFIHFSGNNENNQQSSYCLEDDDPIWQMLQACRSAPYLDMERFFDSEIETLSFTVTSEVLGVYKHGFYITSDGYIVTNLMEWGYVFQIGEESAQEIIRYVKENSIPAVQEPYYHYLYGTFTGTEDGFMLVDDCVLCVNEKDGMIFRIPMEDIRISRDVALGYVSTGDVVLVSFSGIVDTASGNIISNPVSVQKGFLVDGNILIEE